MKNREAYIMFPDGGFDLYDVPDQEAEICIRCGKDKPIGHEGLCEGCWESRFSEVETREKDFEPVQQRDDTFYFFLGRRINMPDSPTCQTSYYCTEGESQETKPLGEDSSFYHMEGYGTRKCFDCWRDGHIKENHSLTYMGDSDTIPDGNPNNWGERNHEYLSRKVRRAENFRNACNWVRAQKTRLRLMKLYRRFQKAVNQKYNNKVANPALDTFLTTPQIRTMFDLFGARFETLEAKRA